MVSAPSEHSGCRLVTRNEHGHQVVTQLLIGGVGIADVHQEAQQAGVLDLHSPGSCVKLPRPGDGAWPGLQNALSPWSLANIMFSMLCMCRMSDC